MSVSIGWKKKDPNELNYIDGTTSLKRALENAFGEFPMELSSDNIDTLKGISVCGFDGADELIEAIYENKCISVDVSW